MKKMLSLAKALIAFMLVFFTTIAFGQTKEETIDWLNSKSPNETQFNDKNIQRTTAYGRYQTTGTTWKMEENLAPYSQIKSINYIAAKEKTGFSQIILFGKFEQKRKESPGDTGKISGIKNFEITFDSSVPEVEIQKIVKALKHLATLEGAKLLNENLFD
ncbi:MAG: hypothetical protein ABS44_01750 [Chryseobacterium sp. SCN 40-13]|nr:MAG: hypothetical protein ABS44_01750 [Chryseobacterium sp. SCN 40-13]